MTKNRQYSAEKVGEKQGIAVYRDNPSISQTMNFKKRKRLVGDEKKGLMLDESTGEILSVGGAAFFEFEEVDDTKFVKIFLDGVKQFSGLSKSALELFELVYLQLQNRDCKNLCVTGGFS